MHVTVCNFFIQTVQLLHFRQCAERTCSENLRLAARKYTRTVHAGKHTYFAPNRTDLRQLSAVGTHTLVQNLGANLLFRQIIQAVLDLARLVGIRIRKMFERVLFDFRLLLFAQSTV